MDSERGSTQVSRLPQKADFQCRSKGTLVESLRPKLDLAPRHGTQESQAKVLLAVCGTPIPKASSGLPNLLIDRPP